ncbi:hypothetical protein H072_6705 [Dactylellina haptotyla CBS 200.50]|uniref:Enterotoxin n=1 Tax=Dactylellina haptotyla (strain CBS 200.50) TaxID=1284197 RepID=S8A920_DACHA|nr:hypothetical protein H072_6705 [Dactylellina haptotyla CBS 200.50]
MKYSGFLFGVLASSALASPLSITSDPGKNNTGTLETRQSGRAGTSGIGGYTPSTDQTFPGAYGLGTIEDRGGLWFRKYADEDVKTEMSNVALQIPAFKKIIEQNSEQNKLYAAGKSTTKKYFFNLDKEGFHANNNDPRHHATFRQWVVPDDKRPFSPGTWHVTKQGAKYKPGQTSDKEILSNLPKNRASITEGKWHKGEWVPK